MPKPASRSTPASPALPTGVVRTWPRVRALIHHAGLLNASLKGDTRRAIDLYEDEWLDEQAFIALVLNLGQS